MAKREYKCPECGEPLSGAFCKNDACPVTDVRALFSSSPGRVSYEFGDVVDRLIATGRVFTSPGGCGVLFATAGGVLHVSLDKVDSLVRTASSFLKMSGIVDDVPDWWVREFLVRLCMVSTKLREVDQAGCWPLLFQSGGGSRLIFPAMDNSWKEDLAAPLRSRYHEAAKYLYLGEPIVPRRTGVFDEWLESFRAATPEDREVLRAWCVGLLLQGVLDPGGCPALLLVSNENGAGKTASAAMIADIFGGDAADNLLLVPHKPGANSEGRMCRQIVGSTTRFVLVDNLTPRRNQQVFSSSTLASLITQPVIGMQALYRAGSQTRVNRLSFIMTSNTPCLSPEVLSRCLVVTISSCVGGDNAWRSTWVSRKRAILEDAIAYCLEGWAENEYAAVPPTYRFPGWYRVVGRVLGRQPLLRGARPAVTPVHDLLVSSVWSWAQGEKVATSQAVTEVVSALRRLIHPELRGFAEQMTEEQFIAGISEWSRRYKIENGVLYDTAPQ